ncbi:unnamed protein product [Umbelopsis sp. WA50703]
MFKGMRCRELKKKCDNGTPSCSRCLDFGAKCLYLTYEQYQRGLAESVTALGDELQEFESTIRRLFIGSLPPATASDENAATDDNVSSVSGSSSVSDTASEESVSLMDELENEVDQEDFELSPNTRKFYSYLIVNRVTQSARSPSLPREESQEPQDPSLLLASSKSALPWQMSVYHTGVSIQTNIRTFKDLHEFFQTHHAQLS